jgi:uncharacterized iron-regulated membrane protein
MNLFEIRSQSHFPMTLFRIVLFWLHLTAGVFAGVVVLIMSATGVALTYEKQMLEWADRRAWSVPPPSGSAPLSPETLLARVREARPEAAPATLTLRADPAAPATVALEGNGSVLVNPYTGEVLGPPPAGLRAFFRTTTNWHRWLAMDGPGRPTGKAITGACNFAFLFIVLSGMYLWLPRLSTWMQFKQVLWFRRGLRGKARDFNWHNAIGIWSAIPLALVVAGAVPISYPWASNLVYRMVGEEPPRPPSGGPGGPPAARSGGQARPAVGRPAGERPARGEQSEPEEVHLEGIDAGFDQALNRVPGWRAITVRIPHGPQPSISYTVDEGDGGQPQFRGTLTVARSTGAVERWETFADQSRGRRLRSWLRFVHTGEFYGLTGQTIAGLVSAGGVVLVWTGISLACRRFIGWIGRRRRATTDSQSTRQAA